MLEPIQFNRQLMTGREFCDKTQGFKTEPSTQTVDDIFLSYLVIRKPFMIHFCRNCFGIMAIFYFAEINSAVLVCRLLFLLLPLLILLLVLLLLLFLLLLLLFMLLSLLLLLIITLVLLIKLVHLSLLLLLLYLYRYLSNIVTQ